MRKNIKGFVNAWEVYILPQAINHSPVRLRADLFNWLCKKYRLRDMDMWGTSIFYQAGYIAGIKAERARRKKHAT